MDVAGPMCAAPFHTSARQGVCGPCHMQAPACSIPKNNCVENTCVPRLQLPWFVCVCACAQALLRAVIAVWQLLAQHYTAAVACVCTRACVHVACVCTRTPPWLVCVHELCRGLCVYTNSATRKACVQQSMCDVIVIVYNTSSSMFTHSCRGLRVCTISATRERLRAAKSPFGSFLYNTLSSMFIHSCRGLRVWTPPHASACVRTVAAWLGAVVVVVVVVVVVALAVGVEVQTLQRRRQVWQG